MIHISKGHKQRKHNNRNESSPNLPGAQNVFEAESIATDPHPSVSVINKQ